METTMKNSTIRTIFLAATGGAVIIAAPALAQTRYSAGEQYTNAIAQPFYQGVPAASRNAPAFSQNWTFGNDQAGQIRNEYLKDSPTHNGNSY
jgi:hypothetical protein